MREKVVYVQYGGGLAIYRETGSIFKPIGGMDGYSLSNSKRSNQEEGINGLTGFVWENSRTDGTRPHA